MAKFLAGDAVNDPTTGIHEAFPGVLCLMIPNHASVAGNEHGWQRLRDLNVPLHSYGALPSV